MIILFLKLKKMFETVTCLELLQAFFYLLLYPLNAVSVKNYSLLIGLSSFFMYAHVALSIIISSHKFPTLHTDFTQISHSLRQRLTKND